MRAEEAERPRLPRRDQVERVDIGVLGIPFDAGTTFRPGARFGPNAIREASRLLRPYHAALDVEPFAVAQVADCGDVTANPFSITEGLAAIEAAAEELITAGARVVALGGDHTVAVPLLRATARRHGPVTLLLDSRRAF